MAVFRSCSTSPYLVDSSVIASTMLITQLTTGATVVRRLFRAGYGSLSTSAMAGSSAWHSVTISMEWSHSTPANRPIPKSIRLTRMIVS